MNDDDGDGNRDGGGADEKSTSNVKNAMRSNLWLSKSIKRPN